MFRCKVTCRSYFSMFLYWCFVEYLNSLMSIIYRGHFNNIKPYQGSNINLYMHINYNHFLSVNIFLFLLYFQASHRTIKLNLIIIIITSEIVYSTDYIKGLFCTVPFNSFRTLMYCTWQGRTKLFSQGGPPMGIPRPPPPGPPFGPL